MSKNVKTALEKIDDLSTTLGLGEDERTIFEITPTQNPNEKFLSLKSGSWDGVEPWFGIDEQQNLHTVISIKSLSSLIAAYRNVLRENFDLRLERSIWQNVPADFGDVWAVAMEELKKSAKETPMRPMDVDVDRLVKDIKKKYPNLFINVKEMMQKTKGRAND